MTRLLSLAAVSLFAVPAFADGVASPEPQPTIAVPAEKWTEFYGGVQLDFIDGDSAGAGDAEFDGTLFGIFAGYRHDFGSLVGGVEVDYVTGDGDFTPIDPAGPVFDMDYDSLLRIGAELGYDAGSSCPMPPWAMSISTLPCHTRLWRQRAFLRNRGGLPRHRPGDHRRRDPAA